MKSLQFINESLNSLNNSKFFAGLIMIMLNIGSKYVTIKLSKTQEQFLQNSIARQILIFSIIWMGTRDVIMSLLLTASFVVMTDYLFNENSSFCIVPENMRALNEHIDINDDNIVSESELNNALKILEKAKNREKKKHQMELVNSFRF